MVFSSMLGSTQQGYQFWSAFIMLLLTWVGSILFYNRGMFKKRAIKKQTNIEDLLTEITTPSVAPGQENGRDPDLSNIENVEVGKSIKMNKNSSTTNKNKPKRSGEDEEEEREDYSKINETKIKLDENANQERNQLNRTQIQRCFAELEQEHRKLTHNHHQQMAAEQNQYRYHMQQEQQNQLPNPQLNEQPQFNNQIQQEWINQQQPQDRKLPVIHEVIIEDDSGEQIQVREDYGEVSDLSGSEDYQQGYENQIIKKTLSKFNYDRVSKNLASSSAKNKQNKLLKELQKVSYSGIQRKIAKDLRVKRSKKSEVVNEVKFIDSKIKQRQSEIADRIRNKEKVSLDLDRIKRILQLLYYYGSQIETEGIDEAGLSSMVYEEEWKDRIDRIRQNLLKNKKQFDQRRRKDDVEESQKQKSEGSEGDVEEIKKHRVENGWDGWPAEEDEDGNAKNEDENNDDDQCMLIDD